MELRHSRSIAIKDLTTAIAGKKEEVIAVQVKKESVIICLGEVLAQIRERFERMKKIKYTHLSKRFFYSYDRSV